MKRVLLVTAVLLLGIAPLLFGQAQDNVALGFNPNRMYQFGDVDNVNLNNGNLVINVPIGMPYGVDEALSFQIGATYNVKAWNFVEELDPNANFPSGEMWGRAYPNPRTNAGLGWRVSLGTLLAPWDPNNHPRSEDQHGWKYIGPAGDEHEFIANCTQFFDCKPPIVPQTGDATPVAGLVAYTYDSTYLTLSFPDTTHAYINFPNGEVRKFAVVNDRWRLVEIRSAFGRALTIGYEFDPFDSHKIIRWVITDLFAGRTHYVYFKATSGAQLMTTTDDYGRVVDYIELQTIGDQRVRYNFNYTMTLVNRPCEQTHDWIRKLVPLETEPRAVSLPLLTSIALPDGSSWDFSYVPSTDQCQSGLMSTMKLPTGGLYEYTYGTWTFPPTALCDWQTSPYQDQSSGIVRRTVDGAQWNYHHDYAYETSIAADNIQLCPVCADGNNGLQPDPKTCPLTGPTSQPSRWIRTSVLNPHGDRSDYYFGGWSTWAADPTGIGSNIEEYGLPFTRGMYDQGSQTTEHQTKDSDGRYLSTQIFEKCGGIQEPPVGSERYLGNNGPCTGPDVKLMRTTYVRYELDGAENNVHINHRVASERTEFNDDPGGCAPFTGACGHADTNRSDWDRLGHYRTETTAGNFAGGNVLTTYTNYNPGNNPPGWTLGTMPPATGWSLGTYTEQKRTYGSSVIRSLSCFDSTGFLTRRRFIGNTTTGAPSGTDVISRYTRTTPTDLTATIRDETFGGDGANVGNDDTPTFCGMTLTAPRYRTDYTFTNGIMTKAQWFDGDVAKFLSIDRTVDDSTGLVTKSRDAAGVETLYDYDRMGRVTTVTPPAGIATSSFAYFPAASSAFAYVEETTSSPLGTKKQYQFDRLGRLWREKSVMPDGTWSVKETLYDGMGWKKSVSEAATLPGVDDDAFVPPYKTTYDTYDAFGRPLSVTAPDGSKTTMTYVGTSFMSRAVKVAMEQGLTDARTEETYDRFGHLIDVREPNGVHTAYGYDAAGKLTDVCMNASSLGAYAPCTTGQPRSFTYDGRGFLEKERHPENGLFRYTYDSRGHVTKKFRDDTTTYDLTFGYDFAERLRTVTAGASTTLKSFDYGENPPSSGDKNTARLITATRHNYLHREDDAPGATHDYTVTERYYYEDGAGRQSRKVTEIHDPIINATKSLEQSQTYNDLSLPDTVTYPHCETGCDGPQFSIANTYTKAMLSRVSAAGTDIARFRYSPSGVNTEIDHVNQSATITDKYTLDSMSRTSSIEFQSFQCAAPNVTSLTSGPWVPGLAVTLTVQVTGQGPISYQWYDALTNQPIANATNATYTTPALNTGGRFFVRLKNECGQRDSSALGFGDAACNFSITTQPASESIKPTDVRTLSVGVNSPADVNVAYQWYRGVSSDTTTPIAGATGATYTTQPSPVSLSYWVRASANSCSSDSNTATLSVCDPIVIRVQPKSSMKLPASDGSAVILTANIDAVGVGLQVQWYEVPPAGAKIPLAQYTPTLSVPFTGTATSNRTYIAKLDDACGSTKWSEPFTLGIGTCINVVVNPQDTIAFPGAGFDMSVRVDGETPDPNHALKYEYHWHHGVNGQDISLWELNDDQWKKPAIVGTLGPAGYDAWWCVIKDTTCNQETTTLKAYVRANEACPLPPASVIPQHVLIGGDSHTFTATCDWRYVTYQWYAGVSGDTRSPISGATTASYDPERVGTYWVRVTDQCGTNHEDSLTLTASTPACDPAVITVQPQSVDITWGDRPTLHVEADNATTYAWYEVGETAQKGWSKNFTPAAAPTVTTSYQAWAANSCDSIASIPATVHIKRCSSINVIAQPAGGTILSTETAGINLAINATSTGGSIQFQWYRGETGDTSHKLEGETSSSIQVLPPATTSYWVRLTTASCTIDSDTAVVTVCTPPQFVGANVPATYDITYGQSIRIGVSATGTGLHYEWHQGSETSTDVVGLGPIITVHPANTTTYFAAITGSCGSTKAAPITVRVCRTPSIDQQPQSVNVFSGRTATLSVHAIETLDAPLAYVWQEINGSTVETSPTFTTPAVTSPKQYVVHVTAGMCSVDSNIVTVGVCTLPEVVNTGSTQNVAVGQTVTLTCNVLPVTGNVYTWYRGTPGDLTNSNQVSYNSSYTYSFTASAGSEGTYWVAVSRPDESCVSHSDAYTVHVCVPVITTQPSSANYDLVHPVALTVAATSSQTMTYQWYAGTKGDTSHPLSGETSPTYNASPTVATSYWCRINSCAPVDSEAAIVTPVCQSVAITGQPAGGSITRGQSQTLIVTATGSAPAYQWYQGISGDTSNPVAGGTSNSLTVNPLNPADYWVKVTTPCDGSTVNSATAHVSVCMTPVITTQPGSTNVFSGQSATLTVAATEQTSEPLHYQWFIAGGGPVGIDLPSFTTPAITQTTQYYVRVMAGVCSVDSNTATVGVCTLPAVINTGTTQNVAIGQNVTLTCITSPATGNTYAWYAGPAGDVAHSTQLSYNSSNTYSFTASASSGGTYWATVSRADDGCVSRTDAYTVNVCIPTITTHPAASTMINSGQSATLTVAANTSGLTYQWYIGTTGTTTSPIANATAASYTASPATSTNYWVKVTGACGQSVNSNTAAVTICQPAAITTQPAALSNIVRGQTATLSVAATGSNLTYQWYQGTSGTTTTPLATTSSMNVNPLNPADYWVKVTSSCGAVNSNTAHVAVCTTPVINTQPQNTSTFSGTSATLTVSASEATGETLHYQWFRNGSTPAGTDSATLNTGNLTSDTTFFVRITAAGAMCTVDSNTVTVSMCPLSQSVTGAPNANTTPGQSVRLQLPTMPGATAYQWYSGASGNTASPIGSWQAASYLDVSPSVTTNYWAQVQNGSCVSNTTTTTVNVCIPTITTQPQSTTITSGSSTTLSVVSNLSGSTYQWYLGASGTTTNPISGATSASYAASPGSTTSYWCKVTGSCGTANSNTATVTVCTTTSVTGPANATAVNRYAYATLLVTAAGTNLAYQWYIGASGNTSQPISGATSSSYTIQAINSEQYWVRVTGLCGTVNSPSAWISVNPIITTQPQQNTYLTSGSRASLSVSAQGTYLHYQWLYANYQPVPNAPDSPLFVSSDITAATTYFCHVTSGANGGADTYNAYVNLCSNDINQGGPVIINQGGNCRQVWANAGGTIDHIEWYQGTKGNTSVLLGSGNYVNVCPSTSTNYWFRVYGSDSGQGVSCYTDSATVTVP